MKLSQLEIVGFKSFGEPIKFSFSKGLTGIVGPNGCGKSNISDAIHWVLGEQNARRLRGGTMRDVIFKGTRKRTAHSFTEVSIIIENDKKILPIEYEEVKITRKLYSDGESEYRINDQNCRLKDILNLFYDTGMGRRAYSFIDQSMIEDLLNSSDEDKRYLFEEAAGIMKYNQSQRTCENKLNLVENDLIRLDDIISEVKYQVGSLRHQVGKAKRYQNLNNSINTIKIQLAGINFFKLHKQLVPMNEKFLALEKKITENNKELAKYEADFTQKEREHLAIEEKIKNEQAKQRSIEYVINSYEKQTLLNKQQIENNKNKLEDTHERIKAIKLQKESRSDVLEKEHQKLEETKEALVEQKKQAETIEKKLSEIKDQVNILYKENDEIYHKINELQSRRQRILNQKNELDTRQHLIAEQVGRISEKITDYSNKYNKFCELVADHEKKQKDNALVVNKLSEKKDLLEKDIEKIKSDEQTLIDESHDITMQIKALENEKQQLVEWERNFAGYSDGTKAILEKFKHKDITTLAETISVKDEYIGLVEQALRNMLLSAVCEENDIQEILTYLKDQKLTSQIILKHHSEKIPKITQIEKTIPLTDVLTLKKGFVHPEIFNNYYIVQDLQTALSLVSQYRDTENLLYFITRDGALFSNHGVVTTHWIDSSSKGLLSRKNELSELDKKISNLNKKHTQAHKSIEDIQNQKEDKLNKLKNLSQEIAQTSDQIEKERKQLVNISVQRDNFKDLVAENHEELSKLEKQKSEIAQGLKDIQEKLAEIPEQEEEELQKKLESVQATLKTTRREQYRHDEMLNDQKIEVTKLEKDIGYITQNIVRIKETALSNEQEMARLQNSIEPLKQDIENLQNETDKLEISFKEKLDELNKFKESNVSIENDFHAIRKVLEEIKITLHELEFKKDVFSSEKSDVELKIQETKIKIDHLKDDVIQHYHHDLSHDKPEEYENLNTSELIADREKQEKRLEGLGPINLAAINDYETQKKRLEFLNEQRQDLVDSKTNLQEAISQLNETAEKMFMNTFTIIQKNFDMIYKEIFDGGKGILKLENPGDPLNSKIEIYSNPKGKKITNITLLSSGEKALTAIALLFSIYLVKPSPFCILDEIDAPLDDSNVGRFLKLVNKFSENTQFLIITHNKRTIEAVDYLYGITMEEEGVSKIVSVKLD
ncbi:MAG: chromosome segregation protein SMC [Candidatus Cloacimonetes bacterium]|nr:chromosome segregation protein SMC [Candidatus Cloacimonadota bacterium]